MAQLPAAPHPADAQQAVADTQAWLERAVIGLNLCPFAKAVHTKGQVRYAVHASAATEALLADLVLELQRLQAADPEAHDTTLLIATNCLGDFLDFNDFLDQADGALDELGLVGEIQIASFHPAYQFAGTAVDDISNFTNRAPYPTLHLLREASIDRAVQAFPEAQAIYEANMRTLEDLGQAGWQALDVGAHR